MLIKWTPEGVTDEDGNEIGSLFTGHVEIEIKPKLERLKMAQELQLEVKGGEVDLDAVGKLEKLDAILRTAVKKVCLKTSEGHKIESLDDLEAFAEGVKLSQHLIGTAINGLSLGKSLRPSSKPQSAT